MNRSLDALVMAMICHDSSEFAIWRQVLYLMVSPSLRIIPRIRSLAR